MSKINSMVRLLNLMNTFHDNFDHYGITLEDERVIAFIYERSACERCTTITDLVVSRYFGTVPTVQRRVKSLEKAGFLGYSRSRFDLRQRCLHLTDDATNYLELLSSYLSQA